MPRSTLLRAYLKKWKTEVGVFFEGVGAGLVGRGDRGHRAEAPGLPPGTAGVGLREPDMGGVGDAL